MFLSDLSTPDEFNEVAGKIAARFTERLQSILTESQFAEVINRNAERTNNILCASHDFCDANMVMESAYADTTGLDPNDEYDESLHLIMWDTAWKIAKVEIQKENCK